MFKIIVSEFMRVVLRNLFRTEEQSILGKKWVKS